MSRFKYAFEYMYSDTYTHMHRKRERGGGGEIFIQLYSKITHHMGVHRSQLNGECIKEILIISVNGHY
jgi:hypothetical protein